MSNRASIVIDVGKSGLRAVMSSGSARHDRSYDGGVSPTDSESATRLHRLVLHAVSDLAGDRDLGDIVIGSTAEQTDSQFDQLATALRVDRAVDAVCFCNDGVLAHAAALGGPGTLISVGTGVIVTFMNARGELGRLDGWGPLLGDLGGASWVGREALARSYRARDLGRSDPLIRLVEQHLGRLNLDLAIELLRDPRWPVTLAELAPAVLGIIDRSSLAQELAEEGAMHIAVSAMRGARVCDDPTIALTGRLLGNARYLDLIRRRIEAEGHPLSVAARSVEVRAEVLLSPLYRSAPGVRLG